jgi:predicted nuclease of predicted toxin-antitoxin system
MKFKVDENLPAELLDDLRIVGHEAETVSDEGLTGVPDAVSLRTCEEKATRY